MVTRSSDRCSGDAMRHYTRINLFQIRDTMIRKMTNKCYGNHDVLLKPKIMNCDTVELEARLKQLNIWRDNSGGDDGYNRYPAANATQKRTFLPYDMMPSFCKRKVVDESIISSQPPQVVEFCDPAIITNQRRIGSGRFSFTKIFNNPMSQGNYSNISSGTIHSRSMNYDGKKRNSGIEEKLRLLQQGVLDNSHGSHNSTNSSGNSSGTNSSHLFFAGNGQTLNGNGSISGTMPMNKLSNDSGIELPRHMESFRRNRNDTMSYDRLNNNSNYVKRVRSGFLVVSNSKEREGHDKRYEHQNSKLNDEPEWYSCGPTSRLDTIELCGFEEEAHIGGGEQRKLDTAVKDVNDLHGKERFQKDCWDNSSVSTVMAACEGDDEADDDGKDNTDSNKPNEDVVAARQRFAKVENNHSLISLVGIKFFLI